MANHYIKNKDFLAFLVKYKADCKLADERSEPHPPLPDFVGECFIKIATNLSRKSNFVSYTFKDEMIGDAIENCLMYFRNFDETKSNNPFAYFTQIVRNAFIRRIDKEKKELYVKYKSTELLGILDVDEVLSDEGRMKQFDVYENITDFIYTFEESRRKKKVKPVKGIENFLEDTDE